MVDIVLAVDDLSSDFFPFTTIPPFLVVTAIFLTVFLCFRSDAAVGVIAAADALLFLIAGVVVGVVVVAVVIDGTFVVITVTGTFRDAGEATDDISITSDDGEGVMVTFSGAVLPATKIVELD